ncbi:MAG: response regulator [Candidatus Pacebacteria bacterium]|nr:response regulator [Candidatus Paceibacterota bacterium]
MAEKQKRTYRIFFIEDEPAIIDLYESAFSGSDFKIKSATTGKEALEKIERFRKGDEPKPDIIVSDILLPDISGLEILKEIRKNKEFDSVPVIMLTNYGTNEIKQTVKQTPNTSHVLKMDTSPVLFVTQICGMVGITCTD